MQRMQLKRVLPALSIAVLLVFPGVSNAERIQTTLTGYEEAPPVSTVADGQFRGMISSDEMSIDYELAYFGLQAPVTQAHIHFGQTGVNGGVVAWLCGTQDFPGPPGTPACPDEGAVSGSIAAAQIQATAPAQQIAAGDLAAVIAAIRAGAAYVNVHTTVSPGGELRGQIRGSRR